MRSAIAVLAMLLLTACTSSVPQPAVTTTSPPASKRTQTMTAEFRLADRQDHAVGANSEKIYGWAQYTAEVSFLDNTFDAEMMAASDYVKGNGTFEGFVTLESPEGDIGLRITGVTSTGAQGVGSQYSGEAEVIGGTGFYENIAGRGQFKGERTGPPGTPVDVQVTLELINPK